MTYLSTAHAGLLFMLMDEYIYIPTCSGSRQKIIIYINIAFLYIDENHFVVIFGGTCLLIVAKHAGFCMGVRLQ